MARYAQHLSPKSTPQSQPIPGRKGMVKNDGGGYSFAIDKWTRFERFLVIGCEGGHFQVGEAKMTVDNATAAIACIEEDPARAVGLIVEISESGRAIKNDPAVFALALAAASTNERARRIALSVLPRVARIFTHLADFLTNVTEFRGWGRSLKSAVANWYVSKDVRDLAYQMTKYQNRNGYTQRDVLRLSHPKATNDFQNELFRWGVGKFTPRTLGVPEHPLAYVRALEYIKAKSPSIKDLKRIIDEFRLAWEHIPTEYLDKPEIWNALLPNMGATALLRNLGRMTANGLIAPLSEASRFIVEKLDDVEFLKRGRIHPFQMLLAQTTYAAGRGVKGSLIWSPDQKVRDALGRAYYASFKAVEPTGKNFYLGVDVSGSMGSSSINNTHITCRVGSACMAMVTMRTEPQTFTMGFTGHLVDLGLSADMTLDQVLRRISGLPFGPTNCAAPMQDAAKRRIPVDAFVIYTDNDTNTGTEHPVQALDRYNREMGRSARLIVVSMAGNGHSIADPNSGNMLDISGFDGDTPNLISNFVGYGRPAGASASVTRRRKAA